jgi:hypothetical protein
MQPEPLMDGKALKDPLTTGGCAYPFVNLSKAGRHHFAGQFDSRETLLGQ